MNNITVSRTSDDPRELELEPPIIDEFVRHATVDGSPEIQDDPEGVVGYFDSKLTDDGRLLFLTFTKHGQRFAVGEDFSPETDRADAAALFFSADAVVELVLRLAQGGPRRPITTHDEAEEFVVGYIDQLS